jgi:hypothetical protein
MTIANASIPIGATFAPSGGSATTIKTKEANGPRHLAFLDDGSALLDQQTADFSYKAPKVSVGAPNGYTQARNTVVVKVPLTLANGNLTVNTIRIEQSCDFETSAADKASLREWAVHLLNDSDFTEFWDDQSAS